MNICCCCWSRIKDEEKVCVGCPKENRYIHLACVRSFAVTIYTRSGNMQNPLCPFCSRMLGPSCGIEIIRTIAVQTAFDSLRLLATNGCIKWEKYSLEFRQLVRITDKVTHIHDKLAEEYKIRVLVGTFEGAKKEIMAKRDAFIAKEIARAPALIKSAFKEICVTSLVNII